MFGKTEIHVMVIRGECPICPFESGAELYGFFSFFRFFWNVISQRLYLSRKLALYSNIDEF